MKRILYLTLFALPLFAPIVAQQNTGLQADSSRTIIFDGHQITITDANDIKGLSAKIDSVEQIIQKEKAEHLKSYLQQGYIPAGYFKIDYTKLLHYNSFEGWKAGVGLWTDKSLLNTFSVGGYWTHSFKRKENLYGAGFNWLIIQESHTKLSVMLKNDYYETGNYSFLKPPQKKTYIDLHHFLTETMDQSKSFLISLNSLLTPNLNASLFYQYNQITPLISYRFLKTTPQILPYFDLQETGIKTCYFPQSNHPIIANPIVHFNLIHGTGHQFNQFNYQKYEIEINQTFKYSQQQKSELNISAGKITGKAPSTILYSTLGSYKHIGVNIPKTFATMRLNEFAVDQFITLFLSHSYTLSNPTKTNNKPTLGLNFNAGFGNTTNVSANQTATFPKGYYETGITLNNLLSLGFFNYGFATFYRLGNYSYPSPKSNFSFQIVLNFNHE